MKWFYVVSGQQVGPVTQEEFDALAQSGTIRPDTLVWREGMPNWVAYSSLGGAASASGAAAAGGDGGIVCSECGKTFSQSQVIQVEGKFVCGTCKPIALQRVQEGASIPRGSAMITDPDALADSILQRGYRLDIGDLIGRAWALVKSNLGISALTVFVVYLVMMAVQIIPCAGGLLGMVINGPLMAGLFWFFLKMHRGEEPTLGDGFAGFKRSPGQLILTSVVSSLLAGLAMAPAIIALLLSMRGSGQVQPTLLFFGLLFLGIIPAIYLSVCWVFALPLVIEHELDFWKAMRLSRRVVHARWGSVFLLMLVGGLLAGLGFLACCVGALVTFPIFFATIAIAYDQIFNSTTPDPVL